MRKLQLFFSWQSDVNDNHKTMGDALKKACEDIRVEGEYDITYDESTWARSGSPVIEAVVVDKIKKCDLFIADLTPITKTGKKDLPNPNVMMELGVAKASMIDDVILLLYSGEIDANRMPFDINHHRMSRFSKSKISDYIRQMALRQCFGGLSNHSGTVGGGNPSTGSGTVLRQAQQPLIYGEKRKM